MSSAVKETTRSRIQETVILGPALKSQLLSVLNVTDDEKLEQLLVTLDRAEASRKEFGETSAIYRQQMASIEDLAIRAAELEADKIMAEFDKQLQGCKL